MRIRAYRLGVLVAWLVVSSLAIAGFAAFRADEEEPLPGAVVATDVGRNAGSVAALSFSFHVDVPPAPSTTVDLDAAVEEAARSRLEASPDTTPAEDPPGTVVRSRYLRETEVRELVSRFFEPGDVNRAIRVAWCESSFNPNAVNPTSGASGLFQHLPEYWEDRSAAAGYPGADIFDPEANVAVAAWLLYTQPGGWTHWACNA